MEEQLEHWSPKDFLALLMLYAAHADLVITDEETELIRRKAGENSYKTACRYFEKHSEYDTLEALLYLRERYHPGEEGKEYIMNFLQEFLSEEEGNVHYEESFRIYLNKVL